MARAEWYSGDYWIYWAGEPPHGQQLPSGEQDHYDLRITEGGVLWLRAKGGDNVLVFPPHTYRYVDVRNISVAKTGKATFT